MIIAVVGLAVALFSYGGQSASPGSAFFRMSREAVFFFSSWRALPELCRCSPILPEGA